MAWRANPVKSPRVLAQSGVPIILLPAGNWTNVTGAMTLGTPLPYKPTGAVWVYLFASGIAAAGLYLATFSSVTDLQLVDLPSTVVGAYTPALTQIVLATVNVPGGSMGPNGAIRWDFSISYTNSASAKSFVLTFGGIYILGINGTATNSARAVGLLRNRGADNVQLQSGTTLSIGTGNTGTSAAQASVNTKVDAPVRFAAQLAATTDYIIFDGYTIELLPS